MEVADQRAADGLALRRAFPEPQRMLGPGRIHAQGHHDQVIADADTVDEDRQQIELGEVTTEDLGELRGGAGLEASRDRRTRRSPGLDVPDRLGAGVVAPRRQAREHPSQRDLGEHVGVGEVAERRQRDLVIIDRSNARLVDLHPASTKRHMRVLSAVARRRAIKVVLALGPHDADDVGFEDRAHDLKPGRGREREQTLLGRCGDLGKCDAHLIREAADVESLLGNDAWTGYRFHAVLLLYRHPVPTM